MSRLVRIRLQFSVFVDSNDCFSLSPRLGFEQLIFNVLSSNMADREDCEGDPEYGKRTHVTSGNTPHKPEDKRRRSTGSAGPVQSRNAKRLSFPRSPANVVSLNFT